MGGVGEGVGEDGKVYKAATRLVFVTDKVCLSRDAVEPTNFYLVHYMMQESVYLRG